MFNSAFDAVVPLLCVTAAALAAMTAEAFRRRDEQMPITPLGIIGLAGAGISCGLLWNRNASSFGVIVADNFSLFVTMTLVIVGILTLMFSSQVVRRQEIPEGDYYTLVLFALVGMIMMAAANDL